MSPHHVTCVAMAQPLHALDLGPTTTPTLRCKKCKVPLPDATRKNCERCRRTRTENYNRWKRSAEARKNQAKSPISIPMPETHPSSAPPSNNVQIRSTNPAQPPHGASTPLQLTDTVTSTSSVSLDANMKHGNYRPPTVLPAPQLMSSFTCGRDVPEYQWSEELVNTLMALPPRSNFVGQFSVVADPDVDNSKRAQMFLDQLRSKGLPTSYVSAASYVRRASPAPYVLLTYAGKHIDLSPATRAPSMGTRSV